MEFNINKEQLKGFGKIGLKLGKAVVIEGTKALVLKTAMVGINTAFSGESIKSITLDDVISGKKKSDDKLVFTNGEEIIDSKTGDIFRKVSSFEREVEKGELNKNMLN